VHVVAIRELAPGYEEKVEALAAALGRAPADLIARLRAAGRGPVVVGTAAEAGGAAALAAVVGGAGLPPLLFGPGECETEETRFVGRSVGFPDEVLRAESRQGETLTVVLATVDLIIRGTTSVSAVETTTSRERKISPGKILLTGGLMLTKTVEKTSRQTTETREGFVHLYAPGQPPVALRESALTYESFGPRRQPSRAANFALLVAELRRRCPAAVYDERLLTRAGQTRLLGPLLSPDEHLDVAITLLVKALR
jgi:hypothetical protein